jgi:hypothetical protein
MGLKGMFQPQRQKYPNMPCYFFSVVSRNQGRLAENFSFRAKAGPSKYANIGHTRLCRKGGECEGGHPWVRTLVLTKPY